ncbi:hypothetical protein M406DRAFT_325253 [Cryphonectria parasitica EP155]|uniref:Uncharacterized protein n=1 Tax=Cryphonectria parasitica (strain ATCC 38755 / EP155) TaxID=660469 RepID=A0A9P4YB47_CRYP1|nr:uncharacterized protein M406DRAFT_325253 [Cryphonectria parasitica EP155]KAF3769769.1 hypothetical protein M406DRAFT_325253 [Cryphonectria parasitica EP155]
MATSTFSTRRQENINRNKALLEELGAVAQAQAIRQSATAAARSSGAEQGRIAKKPRIAKPRVDAVPTRTSARLAAAPTRPIYNDDGAGLVEGSVSSLNKKGKSSKMKRKPAGALVTAERAELDESSRPEPDVDLEELRASWSSWTPTEPAPIRDESGVFHFESHPDFTPNKSPAEVLREGAFGGSYFRPLRSKKLGITVYDDYLELPPSWTEGLNIPYYLTSPTYDPEANKFKVACGQSIEEWEANGWINHQFDVRGWFQWYCRFFAGQPLEEMRRIYGKVAADAVEEVCGVRRQNSMGRRGG